MDDASNHQGESSGRPTPAREAAPSRPTPVRQSLDVDPPPDAVEPDAPEVVFEVEEHEWTARVLGRAESGFEMTPTPVLLLGFFQDDEEEPRLENMVVAETLEGMSEQQLREALRSAEPPPDPDRETELFPGTSKKRRRRR